MIFQKKNLRKFTISTFLLFLTLFFPYQYSFSDQIESERLTKEAPLPSMITKEAVPSKQRWYVGSFYDLGNTVQGQRTGEWQEIDGWLGYQFDKANVYGSFSQLRRFHEKDYTANLGAYFSLNNYYIHEELGGGWDADFIYKFQNILEVSHKLYKNLFWEMGYNYRNYSYNDNYLAYPGLIYYFGDNYASINYGVTHIESRGTGQFGTLKGSLALTKRLRWQIGTSIGQWLYDIYGLSSQKEYGYIAFTMFNIELFKGVHLGLGYSYGTEKPKFIKRSFDCSLSYSF
ncbi:MAG: YaiO family outer membrane beta-barrel protein [Candidatus Omnitrophota bacterium]